MRIECRVLRHSLERTESYIVIRRRVPEGPILLFPELRFNFYQAIVFLVLAKVDGVFFRAQLQSVYFSLYSNLIRMYRYTKTTKLANKTSPKFLHLNHQSNNNLGPLKILLNHKLINLLQS